MVQIVEIYKKICATKTWFGAKELCILMIQVRFLLITDFVEFLDGYWLKRSVQFQPFHDDDMEHVQNYFDTSLQGPSQLKITDCFPRHQSKYYQAGKRQFYVRNKPISNND